MTVKPLDLLESHQPIITEVMEFAAHKAGLKLEIINGLSIWEPSPVYRHQKKSLDIQVSLMNHAAKSGCDCISVADLTILFPDGSIKRPDICIFCKEPTEQETMCTQIPEAVIEILSRGL